MPAVRPDEAARRSVVPSAASRSLWRAAVWTGVGAAVVCATVAIVAVAICWLPVSGSSGRTHSAIHAGLLTFLASVHGGVTVDGTSAAFLPLGMMLAVALTAWRAGAGLADAAAAIDERDPARLALAGLTQAASFALVCVVAVPFSTLGTSSVPFLGVGAAALILFAASGGTALACYSPLSDWCLDRVPGAVRRGARAAAAVLAVYLAAGALLVAASLVVHHGRVEELSRQVGGGWGGAPILLLGLLAAPNAVIAAIGYLAGPGFAVGAGSVAGPFTTAHGTLPAFPILGAVPSGPGANAATWLLVALTPLVAGAVLARQAGRVDGWRERASTVAAAVGIVALAGAVLGWQGGGGIGDGGLRTVGASPWQLGLAVAAAVTVTGSALIAVTALGRRVAGRASAPPEAIPAPRAAAAKAAEPVLRSAAQRLAELAELTRKPPRRSGPAAAGRNADGADDGERGDRLAG